MNLVKNFAWWILAGVLLVLFLLNQNSFFSQGKNLEVVENIKKVKLVGTSLEVSLANTRALRIQGLSGVEELKEGEAMLFVFDYPAKHSFWMKDMNFPIDIIWIAEDGEDRKVVYLKENASPDSYPESFTPTEDAKYVLETQANFSRENNLKVGDEVEFVY